MSEFAADLSRKGLPKRKRLQMLTDKWMQYRYGIMPAIYSMQDIVKLVSQQDYVFRTSRSQSQVDIDDSTESSVPPDSKGVFEKIYGTVKIRGTSKTRFDLGNTARLIDQTSINLAQTAWELVPYSFVADWFANVGEWLLANTHLSVPGVTSEYCVSIKKAYVRETYGRFHIDPLTASVQGPYGTETVSAGAWSDTQLIMRESHQIYDRLTFTPSDVNLYISAPFLSWKRWVDSFSLALSSSNRALRRLT
jgi:hypothetical protein